MKNKRDKYVDSTTEAFITFFRECHDSSGISPTFEGALAWLCGPERYRLPMKAFRELLRCLSKHKDGARYLLWAACAMGDRIEDDGVFIENARRFFSGCHSRFSRPSTMCVPAGPMIEAVDR